MAVSTGDLGGVNAAAEFRQQRLVEVEQALAALSVGAHAQQLLLETKVARGGRRHPERKSAG